MSCAQNVKWGGKHQRANIASHIAVIHIILDYLSLFFSLSSVFMLSCFSRVWLCNPMDCSLPGPSAHKTLQARILEWVAIFSHPFWNNFKVTNPIREGTLSDLLHQCVSKAKVNSPHLLLIVKERVLTDHLYRVSALVVSLNEVTAMIIR